MAALLLFFFLVFIFLFVFWLMAGHFPRRPLYDKPVKEMSEHTLMTLERRWLKGQAFQDHGEMFYVKREYYKPSGDKQKIINAYKRLLEIQEELLRRQAPGADISLIKYAEDLKYRISRTKDSIDIIDRFDRPDPPANPNIATRSQLAKPSSPPKDAELSSDKEYRTQPSTVSQKETITKKPRKKSNKTMFLESFEAYLIAARGSEALVATLKDWIRHPKIIAGLPDSHKRYLINKLHDYKEWASQEELTMFSDILSKLLKQATIDEQP